MNKNPKNNLTPYNTKEAASAAGKVGGKRSAEVQKKKREQKERLLMMLNAGIPNTKEFDKVRAKLNELGIDPSEHDIAFALDIQLMYQILGGDLGARKYFDSMLDRNPEFSLRQEEVKLRRQEASNIAFLRVQEMIANAENIQPETSSVQEHAVADDNNP